MGNDKLIKGTIILTMATIISKVLGFIYVAPFTAMVGTDGYILSEYAYKPYTIMLSLATMGIPMAVSKFVSKYNELGDYRMGRLMLKRGVILLTITGVFWFLLLFFLAPQIAESLVGHSDGTGNNIKDVIFVIRMISVSLIIVPPMAIVRGFFQGYEKMEPTGISQVVEQLARVLFVLVGSVIVLYVFHIGKVVAVGLATLAAFIGALAGSWTLYRYWKKDKKYLDEKLRESKNSVEMSSRQMFMELFSYAIPFVVVGLGIPIYQAADTFMINKALTGIHYTLQEAERVNSIVALVQKIILIPMSLAVGFGTSLVPAITKSFTAKDHKLLHFQIGKTFQVILFLCIPAAVGMMMLSNEIYALMFGTGNVDLGGKMIWWYAPIALFYSIFTVTSSMLQGLNKQKFAVISLLIGLVIKLAINIPMIQHFEAVGTVLTTYIGFGVTILINAWVIKKQANFSYRKILKETIYIIGFVIIMAAAVKLVQLANPLVNGLVASEYFRYACKALIGVAVGGGAYLFISIQTPVFREVIGQRWMFLDKFKIKK